MSAAVIVVRSQLATVEPTRPLIASLVLTTAAAVITPASDRASPPGYPSIPLFSIRSCRVHGFPGFYQCQLRVVQSILRRAVSPILFIY